MNKIVAGIKLDIEFFFVNFEILHVLYLYFAKALSFTPNFNFECIIRDSFGHIRCVF